MHDELREEEAPVPNVPYKSHRHGGLTIEGWSRAAVQSYWRVPELKVGFDIGAHPWAFMSTPTIFISHVHLDHIMCLPAYIARRRLMKMGPPKVYVPEEYLQDVKRFLEVAQRFDRGRQEVNLQPLAPLDEVDLGQGITVACWPTTHNVPGRGYVVYEGRKRLRAEYQGLAESQIRDIKLSGKPVDENFRVPMVAYTGDTTAAGLDKFPDMYRAKVLICEATFLEAEHSPEKIHRNGHVHLNDIIARADRFENELVILGHFSTRYFEDQVRKIIDKRLPRPLWEKVMAWV